MGFIGLQQSTMASHFPSILQSQPITPAPFAGMATAPGTLLPRHCALPPGLLRQVRDVMNAFVLCQAFTALHNTACLQAHPD